MSENSSKTPPSTPFDVKLVADFRYKVSGIVSTTDDKLSIAARRGAGELAVFAPRGAATDAYNSGCIRCGAGPPHIKSKLVRSRNSSVSGNRGTRATIRFSCTCSLCGSSYKTTPLPPQNPSPARRTHKSARHARESKKHKAAAEENRKLFSLPKAGTKRKKPNLVEAELARVQTRDNIPTIQGLANIFGTTDSFLFGPPKKPKF